MILWTVKRLELCSNANANVYRRARRLGAPFVTVCRRFMRRAEVVLQRTISCPAGQFTLSRPTKNVPKAINANEKMENGKSTHSFSILHFQFSICFTFRGFHPGISESLPETPCRIVLPLRRLRRGRTADRTRLTAVLQPYQRALRWKR